jgi:hypothetical protein
VQAKWQWTCPFATTCKSDGGYTCLDELQSMMLFPTTNSLVVARICGFKTTYLIVKTFNFKVHLHVRKFVGQNDILPLLLVLTAEILQSG